jgi:hypothetical protein
MSVLPDLSESPSGAKIRLRTRTKSPELGLRKNQKLPDKTKNHPFGWLLFFAFAFWFVRLGNRIGHSAPLRGIHFGRNALHG